MRPTKRVFCLFFVTYFKIVIFMLFKASALGRVGAVAVPWKCSHFRWLGARLGFRAGLEPSSTPYHPKNHGHIFHKY
jgi:hypothetical protein